jgi:hypothetical protein
MTMSAAEDRSPPRQRAQDLDLLLLGGGQPAGERRGREVEAGVTRELLVAAAQRAAGDEARAARLGAEEHVVLDGELPDDVELLGDGRDPALERLAGRAQRDLLAVEQQPSLVGRQDPGDDLGQRRLAGAVLADERVDRSARDAQGHRVECADGSEVLGDARELDMGVVA